MPAAAVIPAPTAHIKAVVVKKLVVVLCRDCLVYPLGEHWAWLGQILREYSCT